ncbi:MAG: VanW family protein [Bacillota bacterium]
METNARAKSSTSNAITGVIIVLLCFLISTTGILFFLLNRDTIYPGVTIENMDVGGLSTVDAQQKLQEYFRGEDKKIQLGYGDKLWDLTSEDIGYTFDYTKAVHEAYQVGREGSYFERIQKVISLYKVPYNIELLPLYDSNKVEKVLTEIERTVNKPAKDAVITRKNGEFLITQEQVGLKLNVQETKKNILDKLQESRKEDEIIIDLTVEMESPKVTSESLSYIHDLLGVYMTKFSSSSVNRTNNIVLASRALNGKVLLPGEVFSFNEVVGPRSKERGYQDAPVIFQGELVDGLGGGVCQVSSTLYNAILLSNLEVKERSNHSIPSTYVPKGQDATVSYGVLDFKFANSNPYPIYLESYVKGSHLTVNIYGYKIDNRVTKVLSVQDQMVPRTVEIKYDSNLLEGEERIEKEGRDGYRITTYKILYENGVEVGRERIAKDYYKPQKKVIIKGTKKKPVKKPETKAEEKTEEKIEETPASNE